MFTDDTDEVFGVRMISAEHDSVKIGVTGTISFKVMICWMADCSFFESLIIHKVVE